MRWPWIKYRDDQHTDVSTSTGGREARERAERDLVDVRRRRAEGEKLRAWLRRDYERNHYAEAIGDLFRGGNKA